MMTTRIALTFMFFSLVGFSQQKPSKADNYFFAYAYKEAIAAYESDIQKGMLLTDKQRLNLADSYFKTEQFDWAANLYLAYFSNDSIQDNFRLNRLLRSLSETDNKVKLENLLEERQNQFNREFVENTKFNRKLLSQIETKMQLNFETFNLLCNTGQGDFSPAFFKSDLLFTSGRSYGKQKEPTGFLNIFRGSINNDGQVADVIPFEKLPKTEFHKATPNYSKQLNSVFYVLSNTMEDELEFDANGKNTLAVGIQPIEGEFRFLWRDLSISFYYPFYDEANERLYFAADFDTGYGGTDIYYVNTNRGTVMSAPINLGSRINSAGNEIAPFIFENSLYFSSDVFYGLGGMDIYKSNIDGANSYSIPVNLGPQINSVKDDFGFVMREDGQGGLLGYFSSNRDGGKGGDDLYGFRVAEKPGLKTLIVRGNVNRRANQKGLENVVVGLYSESGELLKQNMSEENGVFRIEIPWQEKVVLKANLDTYSKYSEALEVNSFENDENIVINFELVAYDDIVAEVEDQKVIKLKKFFFTRGRATITPEIAIELEKVVDAVERFPQLQLRIETHTDSRGGSATNFRITQARSDAIKDYLISKGVPPTNILYAIGYGEDKILNNCANGVYCLEMLHKQNQRSLIVVLNDNVLFD